MINTNHLCMQCMKEHGGAEFCPHCGYHEDGLQTAPYLPVKTWLMDRYVVGKIMTCDGEGVTYIGWDNILQAPVMIREFLPENLCVRTADGVLVQYMADSGVDFSRTLTAFLTMHRTLSRMGDLPALFPVYDVFEANGTGYAISRYTESITLNEFLHRNGDTLTFEQTKTLMLPAISTLSSLHAADMIHGGISPDTLYVGKDGKLRFAGFAGSELRFARGALKTGLFAGYAAMEQYGFDGNIGPHTDVYAFGATIYRILTGSAPMDAQSRMNHPFTLSAALADKAPAYAVQGLEHAMQLMPLERTATMERFRTEFSAIPRVKEEVFVMQETNDITNEQPAETAKQEKGRGLLYCLIAMLATLLVLTVLFVIVEAKWHLLGVFDTQSAVSTQSLSVASEEEVSSETTDGQLTQTVENFVGQTLEQCKNSNPKYTFTVQYEVYSDEYKKGFIISQTPAAGTEIPLDSDQATQFSVVVSLGSKELTVPDVTGMTCAEAMDKLWEAGFLRDRISFNTDTYTYDSVVTKTEPAANTKLDVYGDNKVMLFITAPAEEETVSTETQSTVSQPAESTAEQPVAQ